MKHLIFIIFNRVIVWRRVVTQNVTIIKLNCLKSFLKSLSKSSVSSPSSILSELTTPTPNPREILSKSSINRVVSGQYIVVLWRMWLTFWKEIGVEGLCLVNTLLSCEVCDEQFEKKSGLKGCVWSIHCCPVKYVMNSLKRNFVWRVVFGHYIVVLWSMWWTVWKEIWFNESYAVSPFNC